MKLGMVKDRARFFRLLFVFALACTALAAGVATIIYSVFSRDLPPILSVEDYRPLTVTQIVDAEGAPLGEFYKERRFLAPYEKFPKALVDAFVAGEDDQFFEHPGINLLSIVRAQIANVRAGHTVQGGSTITQQVAKSLFLSPEKRLDRKIKEAILAYRLEKNLTKAQILYLYLNQIYLGHGAYGVEAAARTYFRKEVSALTLPEAALLAGLPQAPSNYSPVIYPKRAKERQRYVLRRLMETRKLTRDEMEAAFREPVRIFRDESINERYAAYLVEQARRYLQEKYGDAALYEEGLRVTLPVTRRRALQASTALREGLRTIDKRLGYRGPVRRIAGEDERRTYLRALRDVLLQERVGYRLLTAEGELDVEAAYRQEPAPLLREREVREGLVVEVDDRQKRARVDLGGELVEIPLAEMKWAKAPKDNPPPGRWRGEIGLPSHAVARGDVILVRVLGKAPAGGTSAWLGSLEQKPELQGALYSLDVLTGQVLAMEGGFEWIKEKSEFNRAVQASRQPGSAFKPIIYAAALEKGFTPASVIVDSPLVYEDAELGKWKPANYDEKFTGDTTFRQALIKSRNIPTIKLVQAIQVPFLISYARRLGFQSQFPADLSISLGTMGVSLQELTRVYALFPRLGRQVEPWMISEIRDRDGKVLEAHVPKALPADPRFATLEPPVEGEPTPVATNGAGILGQATLRLPTYPPGDDPDQVLDPRVAYVMTHLMKEVVNFGTGYEARQLGRPAAGKTGTTNDSMDAWFMGFTPQVVTGVWVGYDVQRPIGSKETGGRTALPIWLNFMKEVVADTPEQDFRIPAGVAFATIDGLTGRPASPNAANAIREAFIDGTQTAYSSFTTGSGAPTTGGGGVSAPSAPLFKEDLE